MAPRSVLVTGAAGLIGRRLVPALRGRGYEVWSVVRSGPDGERLRSFDLTDPAACALVVGELLPDVVVHLAGGVSSDEERLYADNVLSTLNLIRACEPTAHRPRFVVFGSAAEYGSQPSPIAESAPTAPVSSYGRAKLAATMLARAEARRLGAQLTVLRPFNVVAPDLPATTALGNLRNQLLVADHGTRRVRCGRTDVRRDYVTVDSVVDVTVAVLEASSPPAVLNVCSGLGISLDEIISASEQLVGATIELERDPELVRIPAPDVVVGDPSLLAATTDVTTRVSADAVARVLFA